MAQRSTDLLWMNKTIRFLCAERKTKIHKKFPSLLYQTLYAHNTVKLNNTEYIAERKLFCSEWMGQTLQKLTGRPRFFTKEKYLLRCAWDAREFLWNHEIFIFLKKMLWILFFHTSYILLNWKIFSST